MNMVNREALIQQPWFVLLSLFAIALIALFPGIGEVTGITGKDEYLLTIRTPMHMIEGSHGWLPWLDGLPRLRKPPLLYWLGKVSYELFGVSLTSARMIGVLFASTLVIATAALSLRLYGNARQAFLSGLMILGMVGIMIDGRRYLLDIPVAALSTLAVLLLLAWDETRSTRWLLLSMCCLGLAFLSKGPVSLIFYLSAFFAWLLTRSALNDKHPFNWTHWILSLSIPLLLVISWYAYVYKLYPDQLIQSLQEEAQGRNLLQFSLGPFFNLIVIALPWSPVAFYLIVRALKTVELSSEEKSRLIFLAAWLVLSIVPFFFFRTFSRYLYGVLVPFTLLAAILISNLPELRSARFWLRTGAFLSLLIGSTLTVFVFWFREIDLVLLLSLLPLLLFAYTWWKAASAFQMALAAILYWVSITAAVYPRMDINSLPEGSTDIIENEYTVLYAGPQPAMLPVATGRGLRATSRLWTLPPEVLDACNGFLLFMPENMLKMAQRQMADLKLKYTELDRYKILSSRGSWLYFTREGTTMADWKRAIREHDVDSLGTDILLLRAQPAQCSR